MAEAARRLGIRATIVMPSDAPRVKMQNTRDMGAEVVEYDRVHESREQIAARIAAERGATLVPSFDDPDVIAGQGTVGLEIAEQAAELGLTLDDVVVCCSGGGLTAGIVDRDAAARAARRDLDRRARSVTTTIGARSESGRRQRNEPGAPASICDALLAPMPGELTFAINQPLLRGGLAVSDDEVRRAMAFAARTLKLVVEPGGAVALACVMAGKLDTRDRTVAVTLSGGNIDDALFAEILAAALSAEAFRRSSSTISASSPVARHLEPGDGDRQAETARPGTAGVDDRARRRDARSAAGANARDDRRRCPPHAGSTSSCFEVVQQRGHGVAGHVDLGPVRRRPVAQSPSTLPRTATTRGASARRLLEHLRAADVAGVQDQRAALQCGDGLRPRSLCSKPCRGCSPRASPRGS